VHRHVAATGIIVGHVWVWDEQKAFYTNETTIDSRKKNLKKRK